MNLVLHERINHIEIDCHVVRDKVHAGILHFLPIASKDQVVDIRTKSLYIRLFSNQQSKLGIIDMYSSMRGGVKHVS